MKVYTLMKCPVCNEEFIVYRSKDYAWKFKDKLLCSYSCMRKLEKPFIKENKEKIKKDYEKYYGKYKW